MAEGSWSWATSTLLISCHKQLSSSGLINNQKGRRPDAVRGTANPDVLFTPHHCLHKNTIILTDLGKRRGGRKGNTLYQWRDLQSLRSLEKKRIQLCCEKINPKAAKYKGLRVPSERLQDSSKELVPRGNAITGLRRHRGLVSLALIPGIFFLFTRDAPCLPSY